MRTSCHRCAFYSSRSIVNLPLINHTVSPFATIVALTTYFPSWILHQFLAIQGEFIVYLVLEFIRAEHIFFRKCFPEIFQSEISDWSVRRGASEIANNKKLSFSLHGDISATRNRIEINCFKGQSSSLLMISHLFHENHYLRSYSGSKCSQFW